jgi:cytochrome c biogenesis protein CcmG/thiol:disulfide interchange protein DsbE
VDAPEEPPLPPLEEGGKETSRWDRRRTIGAIVGGALVLGVVVLLVVGLANKDLGTSIQDALKEGRRPVAPTMTLPVLTAADGIGPVGSDVSTADLKGRIVVLNFWASWCDPCELEAPVLEAVAARYRSSKDVLVLGVNVQDLREKARAFVERNGLTYPSLRDGTDGAQHTFEVPALPETFVIDEKGLVALKVAGQLTKTAQLTNAIEQLRRASS